MKSLNLYNQPFFSISKCNGTAIIFCGLFSIINIISAQNGVAPVFANCDDLTICTYDPQCNPLIVALTQSATDDSTASEDLIWSYLVDLGNDGNFDITNGNSNDASGVYSLNTPDISSQGAYHRILWTVEDEGGNKAICEQLFRVVDCEPPVPVCYNGLAADVLPFDSDGDGFNDTGRVTIFAGDFNASSFDNCASEQNLKFSFSSDTLEKSRNFGCADLGTNIIRLWVTDEYGNQADCETYIIIQDYLVCEGPSTAIIGKVLTKGGNGIENVKMTIKANALPEHIVYTDVNGRYISFNGINTTYTIEGELNDKPLNGVSTIDLVMIQKHLLNVINLSTFEKMLAADVNKSCTITAADIVEVRKLLLGKIQAFTNNNSWKIYVDNLSNSICNIQDKRIVENFNHSLYNEDFVGVKIADVNGSAKANNVLQDIETRSGAVLNFMVAEQSLIAGQTYSIPFTADRFDGISGYQFTLCFDKNALTFEGIEPGKLDVGEENFGLTMLDKGWITTSWNQIDEVKAEANEILFTLSFTAKSNGKLSDMLRISSDFTVAEAYNEADQLVDLKLQFEGINNNYELFQNVPNPFSKSTLVEFNLPEDMKGKISVCDVTGKVMKVVERTFIKGNNQVTFTKDDLSGTGIFYYTLETDKFTATKQMISVR